MEEQIQKKKSSGWKWFWGITAGVFLLVFIFVGLAFMMLAASISKSPGYGSDNYYLEYTGKGKDKIAIVDLDFPIYSSADIVRQFKKFGKDKSIKAIVLRIDSPGGGVASSQEIYEIVKQTRDSGKPVIVSFGSIAASGGYYVACGSSLIVSNPGSITGSIGVIANFISWKELTDKIGIQDNTIKSGDLKDSGNPFRNMNEVDKEYFQDLVNNTFEQFFGVVLNERKLPEEKLRELADGRVFTGEQALNLGLVDTLGTFEDAVRIAANIAGIEKEPVLVRERKRLSFWERVILETKGENELLGISKFIRQEYIDAPILQYKFEQ